MELLLINIKPDISTLLRRGHFYFAMTFHSKTILKIRSFYYNGLLISKEFILSVLALDKESFIFLL